MAQATRGDLDDAIGSFTQIIGAADESWIWWALLDRGGVHALKHGWKDALDDFRKAVALNPGSAGHARILAWFAQARLGEKEAADKELARWLKDGSLDGSDWEGALAGHLLGQVTDKALVEAAEASPAKTYTVSQAWFYIAAKQALAGDRKAAAVGFEKSLEAARKKLPPNYWLPPECFMAGPELKALESGAR